MATVIRLQRHGRKNYPVYKIVVADSRAPRDGRFIEKLGTYNPNVNPAAVELVFDRALYWINVGAQPSDTVRSLLSREGVMMMKHLQGGVKKGAFSEEEAQARFDRWMQEKKAGVEAVRAKDETNKVETAKKALEAEREKNKQRAEALAAKKAEEEAAKRAAEAEAAKEAEASAEAEVPASEESAEA